ncbi:ankyrin repeat protein [Panacagrimonas perspica]|uniref:Ankyrin repeat protein n=1 Tax=Panacagrimonas perspica TaxID=381431 RepID=A0A4V6RR13_9GAMM|nr:ankyrin repeat domain-containing protein [Panacagrimonas perspica]TDU31010.1 ankyrin repeat protein [Panacagrimonas perspica]THD01841.1 hypothetical protein B1810_17725 [Panacagrimonas perspica]
MKRTALSLALLALAGLSGCASTSQPGAAPAATAQTAPDDGIGAEERISFFVNDARSGHLEQVVAALDRGVPVDSVDAVDQTALLAAASKNQFEIAKLLLERGANPEYRDPAGWTPLIHATYFGSSLELISLLVEKGANVNTQNDRGVTALYLAAAGGHEAYVQHLLKLGADPKLSTTAGYTPLRVAQANGLTRIVALLESGATPATSTH